MFQKARIKLTIWYLLIIMLISVVFSCIIYSGINRELGRFERVQELRLQREKELTLITTLPHEFDAPTVAAARMRLTLTLIFINVGILGIAGIAGYFLAGRTLRPIQEMVDDQNQFVTDASHELRTPLTSLKTSIEVGLRNKNMALDEAKELLASNLEDVEDLRILSDGLIRLAQYQKPNGNILFEEILVKEIVDSAIDKVKAMAIDSKIKLSAKIEKIEIKGDKKSLVELLVILLDNAIKYSKKNLEVLIIVKKLEGKVEIAVSDEGVGIDEKDLPHIFDRFYRAEKSRSKEHISGYGLGLSIAKKIVEIHNGLIEVSSKAGEGTTFTIII